MCNYISGCAEDQYQNCDDNNTAQYSLKWTWSFGKGIFNHQSADGNGLVGGFCPHKPDLGFHVIGVDLERAFVTFDLAVFIIHHARQ